MSRKKIILAGLTVLCVSIYFFLGTMIASAVERLGPDFTGTPVKLDSVHLNPFTGSLVISGFELGNPEGYNTDYALRFKEVYVNLKLTSLFSDVITVEEVIVDQPQVSFEGSLTGSNISKIQDHLNDATRGSAEDESPSDNSEAEDSTDAPADSGGLVIDKLSINEGKITLSVKLMQGLGAPIPLPSITLNDIGKDQSQGVSLVDSFKIFFDALTEGILSALSGVGHLFKDLGEGLVNTGKGIGEGLKDTSETVTDGLKKLFGD